jgi:hypothetical protein
MTRECPRCLQTFKTNVAYTRHLNMKNLCKIAHANVTKKNHDLSTELSGTIIEEICMDINRDGSVVKKNYSVQSSETKSKKTIPNKLKKISYTPKLKNISLSKMKSKKISKNMNSHDIDNVILNYEKEQKNKKLCEEWNDYLDQSIEQNNDYLDQSIEQNNDYLDRSIEQNDEKNPVLIPKKKNKKYKHKKLNYDSIQNIIDPPSSVPTEIISKNKNLRNNINEIFEDYEDGKNENRMKKEVEDYLSSQASNENIKKNKKRKNQNKRSKKYDREHSIINESSDYYGYDTGLYSVISSSKSNISTWYFREENTALNKFEEIVREELKYETGCDKIKDEEIFQRVNYGRELNNFTNNSISLIMEKIKIIQNN